MTARKGVVGWIRAKTLGLVWSEGIGNGISLYTQHIFNRCDKRNFDDEYNSFIVIVCS